MKRCGLLIAVVLGIWLGPMQARAGDPPTVAEIIEADGVFSFTDGSSVYHLRKDGEFALEPNGMSGQTIVGKWTTEDHRTFVVIGKWSWMNGISVDNDYRKLTFAVSYHGEEATRTSFQKVEVYGVYMTVQELVKVTEKEWKKAMGK